VTDVARMSASETTGAAAPEAVAEAEAMSGPRLQEFESEIRKLRVKGGAAEPERRLVVVGVLATVIGLVVAFIGLSGVRSAETALEQGDGLAQTIIGIGVAIVGAVVWARYSLSRYLRYWLVRDLYEARSQTDRMVEAIEKLSIK
jgi:hypothetical protein